MPKNAIVGLSLGLGVSCVTLSLDVIAQRTRTSYRMGVLDAGSKNSWTAERLDAELRKSEGAEGVAYTFEQRWSERNADRLLPLATELAKLELAAAASVVSAGSPDGDVRPLSVSC